VDVRTAVLLFALSQAIEFSISKFIKKVSACPAAKIQMLKFREAITAIAQGYGYQLIFKKPMGKKKVAVHRNCAKINRFLFYNKRRPSCFRTSPPPLSCGEGRMRIAEFRVTRRNAELWNGRAAEGCAATLQTYTDENVLFFGARCTVFFSSHRR
jgi:hypothetical protein